MGNHHHQSLLHVTPKLSRHPMLRSHIDKALKSTGLGSLSHINRNNWCLKHCTDSINFQKRYCVCFFLQKLTGSLPSALVQYHIGHCYPTMCTQMLQAAKRVRTQICRHSQKRNMKVATNKKRFHSLCWNARRNCVHLCTNSVVWKPYSSQICNAFYIGEKSTKLHQTC